MKLTIIATLIKLNINPQRYGDDLYAEALGIFMKRIARGY
jgi:hypothetical protein